MIVILDLNGILCNKRVPIQGARKFVITLLNKYKVAVYSSCIHKNIIKALNSMSLSTDSFEFIWDRNYCFPDWKYRVNNNYATFKTIPKLLADNSLMVDDSEVKTRFIKHRLIYKVNGIDDYDELLELIDNYLLSSQDQKSHMTSTQGHS